MKKQQQQRKKKCPAFVITHGGPFHGDDVLACAAVKLWAQVTYQETEPAFKRLSQRERDDMTAVVLDLEAATVDRGGCALVDLGGEYDPKLWRFDHHQHGGLPKHPENVPIASAGLVWLHLGHEIVEAVWKETSNMGACTDDDVRTVWDQVRKSLILPVDKWDNGLFPRRAVTAHFMFSEFVQLASDYSADRDADFLRFVGLASQALMSKVRYMIRRLVYYNRFEERFDAGEITANEIGMRAWFESAEHYFTLNQAKELARRRMLPFTVLGLLCPNLEGRNGEWLVVVENGGCQLPRNVPGESYRAKGGTMAAYATRDAAVGALETALEGNLNEE